MTCKVKAEPGRGLQRLSVLNGTLAFVRVKFPVKAMWGDLYSTTFRLTHGSTFFIGKVDGLQVIAIQVHPNLETAET